MDIKNIIIYFLIGIMGILAVVSIVVIFFVCTSSDIKTVFASLFMGSITLMGILINFKFNMDLMKYNNELFDENLNSRF